MHGRRLLAVLALVAGAACSPGAEQVDKPEGRDTGGVDSVPPADSAPPVDSGDSARPVDSGDDSGVDTAAGPDADGDGSPDDEDCDDADPAVYPGGPDVCHDGIDTNCDGVDDTCDWAGEENIISYTADVMEFEPYDPSYWHAVCAGSDVDGDGVGDIVIGADHPDPADVRVYVVRGGATFPESASDGAWASLSAPGDASRYAENIDCAGDLDGDGREDFLLQAAGDELGTLVMNGVVAGAQDRDAATGITVAGTTTLWPGTSRGSADLDGDGDDDLALSYPAGDAGDGWGVAMFAGPLAADVTVGDAFATVTPGAMLCQNDAGTGCEPSLDPSGDFDGDGLLDLAAGHGLAPLGGGARGAAWVFLGPFSGEQDGEDADLALVGEFDYHSLGNRVAAGDLDGDGYDDLVAGSAGAAADSAIQADGAVYVFPGGPSLPAAVGDALAVVIGPRGSALGYYLASGRDLDGDGRDEVAMYSGRVLLPESDVNEWVVFVAEGPAGGVDAIDLPGRFHDPTTSYTGTAMNLADDVTGDGRPDLVVDMCPPDGGCYRPPRVVVARGGA